MSVIEPIDQTILTAIHKHNGPVVLQDCLVAAQTAASAQCTVDIDWLRLRLTLLEQHHCIERVGSGYSITDVGLASLQHGVSMRM